MSKGEWNALSQVDSLYNVNLELKGLTVKEYL